MHCLVFIRKLHKLLGNKFHLCQFWQEAVPSLKQTLRLVKEANKETGSGMKSLSVFFVFFYDPLITHTVSLVSVMWVAAGDTLGRQTQRERETDRQERGFFCKQVLCGCFMTFMTYLALMVPAAWWSHKHRNSNPLKSHQI